MPDKLEFVETDAAFIYTAVMEGLMDAVNEPLYPGDERRIFGEGLVAVLVAMHNEFNDKMRQRTLRYARGKVLDALGERYGIRRAEAARAFVTLRFTAEQAQAQNIIIDAGTKVTTDGSVYFATDELAVLQAGQQSVEVRATCTAGGELYNGYTAGSINTLVDLIPYITAVSNTTISMGGDDGEPYTDLGDAKLRERIRLAPAKQSTAGPESAYRYYAMSADPRIIDIAVDSPSPTVIKIYPLLTNGEIPEKEVLDKVEAACSANEVRPMTDKVEAVAPTAVTYDIELKYYCTKFNEAATVKMVEGLQGAIQRYNAWQTGAMNRDINPDQLRRLILAPDWQEGLIGADRVDITKPNYTEIGKHQVAKYSGQLTVSHEVVG